MTSIIIWFIMLAWVSVLLIPLINKILTTETITTINSMLDNLEYFIGSDNITLFLCLMIVILIIVIIRFFNKFFHVNND